VEGKGELLIPESEILHCMVDQFFPNQISPVRYANKTRKKGKRKHQLRKKGTTVTKKRTKLKPMHGHLDQNPIHIKQNKSIYKRKRDY